MIGLECKEELYVENISWQYSKENSSVKHDISQ